VPLVTNALEELAASIFRTHYANGRFLHNVGNYRSMGSISVMMEIRIVCHACKLASVSDFKAFESEDELLSYYVSLNGTWQRTCAVVFENLPQDGDVYDLQYKIRISNKLFSTAQLFPEILLWPQLIGKTDNICNKYII
jgi:hypothetical protein